MAIDFERGEVFLVDKPYRWTSFDVVNHIRYFIKKRFEVKRTKIGHAGTLDPLATGLLIICIGKATKRIDEYQQQEKEYTGTFVLGATTPSFDLETCVDETFSTDHLTNHLIKEATKQFVGDIKQVPPVFSAVKIKGKRAYEYARNNDELILAPKEISISCFEITRVNLPEIDFRIICSKGTYIRALARDFGIALKTGAYLSKLCRTRIGTYKLSEALDIEAVKEKLTEKHLSP